MEQKSQGRIVRELGGRGASVAEDTWQELACHSVLVIGDALSQAALQSPLLPPCFSSTRTSASGFVLFWGKVTENGIGLRVERLKWGEYAVLPQQYDGLLPRENA